MDISTLIPTGARYLPVLLILAGAAPLLVAYYSQLVQGHEPCVLCLYQRIPFAIVIVSGFAGVFRPALAPLMGAAGALAFLVGSGIALYHVGVEQHWWASAASCGGGLPGKMTIEDLRQGLLVKPEKACGDVDWTLFGISMATYNVAYSGVLAVLAAIGARRFTEARGA